MDDLIYMDIDTLLWILDLIIEGVIVDVEYITIHN
jgi:hypothetical protein